MQRTGAVARGWDKKDVPPLAFAHQTLMVWGDAPTAPLQQQLETRSQSVVDLRNTSTWRLYQPDGHLLVLVIIVRAGTSLYISLYCLKLYLELELTCIPSSFEKLESVLGPDNKDISNSINWRCCWQQG